MQKHAQDWRANFSLIGTRHDSGKGKDRLSVYIFSLRRNDNLAGISDGFGAKPGKMLKKEIDSPRFYTQFTDELQLKHNHTRIARFTFRFSDDGKTAFSRNYPPPGTHEGYVLSGLAEYMALSDLHEMGARSVQFLDGGVFNIAQILGKMRNGVERTEFSSKPLL
ncbi:MAG: hypothetical protein WC861_03755 [Candidatus Micrarchaeia archaeon]|jgi:hypothetical protein